MFSKTISGLLITDSKMDNVYTVWYAFFGIMKVEFKKTNFAKFKSSYQYNEALQVYEVMKEIIQAGLLNSNNLEIIYHDFTEYAYKFNELRKLMYGNKFPPKVTVH